MVGPDLRVPPARSRKSLILFLITERQLFRLGQNRFAGDSHRHSLLDEAERREIEGAGIDKAVLESDGFRPPGHGLRVIDLIGPRLFAVTAFFAGPVEPQMPFAHCSGGVTVPPQERGDGDPGGFDQRR